MEVAEMTSTKAGGSEDLATDEDLLFADDGETAEYTTGEVDQLLGEDEDAEHYYSEDGALEGQEVAHEDNGDKDDGGGDDQADTEDHDDGENRESGRGARRGMRGGRFMRGMMGPRFYPLLPGMRPPFPPFMMPGRPPFLMRGMRPMRMPMPPMPMHMMRGMMHRYGGPAAMRGRGVHGDGQSKSSSNREKESGDTSSTKTDGPKPLMSLELPDPVKAMVHAQQQGTGIMGLGMTSKYLPGASGNLGRRGSSQPSRGGPSQGGSSSMNSLNSSKFSRPPQKRPMQNSVTHMDHGEPRPKMAAAQRSNLTFIKTVDEPMQTSSSRMHQSSSSYQQRPGQPSSQYGQSQYGGMQSNQGYGQNRQNSSAFTVAHRPAPNLTLIQLTPSNDVAMASVPTVRGFKVMVWNLPPAANFAEVSAMTTSCGSVRTLNVRHENNTAVIEFSNAQSADHFVRLYNNTVMSGCLLTVSRI